MTKKFEKLAAVLLFLTMFIFINQLEVGVLPFFIAFSGVISCGSLSVIFFMRSFNLSFKLSLESTNDPVSAPRCAEPACQSVNVDLAASWLNQTHAA